MGWAFYEGLTTSPGDWLSSNLPPLWRVSRGHRDVCQGRESWHQTVSVSRDIWGEGPGGGVQSFARLFLISEVPWTFALLCPPDELEVGKSCSCRVTKSHLIMTLGSSSPQKDRGRGNQKTRYSGGWQHRGCHVVCVS